MKFIFHFSHLLTGAKNWNWKTQNLGFEYWRKYNTLLQFDRFFFSKENIYDFWIKIVFHNFVEISFQFCLNDNESNKRKYIWDERTKLLFIHSILLVENCFNTESFYYRNIPWYPRFQFTESLNAQMRAIVSNRNI